MRVGVEFLGPAVDGPPATLVTQEDAREAVGDLLGDLKEIHQAAGAGRALDREVVPIVQIEAQERSDDEGIHRKPDRPTPIRIAAEHATVRLRRQIVYPVFVTTHMEDIRMPLMDLGER